MSVEDQLRDNAVTVK